jgi:hypothetical protein
MRDLDELALALPEVTKQVSPDGRPTYQVNGKTFAFHRPPRPDAPFDDVLAIWVDGLEVKDILLADPREIFFTTPHWNGYAAVLLHIPALRRLKKAELRDLLVDAWLTKAPKRVAKAWLAENET